MRIIIAIDIIDGKCVRLTKGDFGSKKIYNDDPLEVARQIEAGGLEYLHLVDLDGAKNKKSENLKVLEKIVSGTKLKVDFGGGIRTDEDIKNVFEAGASQITAGSIAIKNMELVKGWINKFGPDKIILGADFRNRKIATAGWLEGSDQDVIIFIEGYIKAGLRYTICTDIEKDGMLQGPATEIYKEIMGKTGISLIASGGISNLNDCKQLSEAGCEGAIIGKAYYEGKVTLKELRELC
jgi:phosphoribosylformimino-5-aminoimidazole carboxamide ribotide isomerase